MMMAMNKKKAFGFWILDFVLTHSTDDTHISLRFLMAYA